MAKINLQTFFLSVGFLFERKDAGRIILDNKDFALVFVRPDKEVDFITVTEVQPIGTLLIERHAEFRWRIAKLSQCAPDACVIADNNQLMFVKCHICPASR